MLIEFHDRDPLACEEKAQGLALIKDEKSLKSAVTTRAHTQDPRGREYPSPEGRQTTRKVRHLRHEEHHLEHKDREAERT